MKSPKIENIIKYFIDLYSESTESVPPPVLIKGHRGTGKSWVLERVYDDIVRIDGSVVPVRMPLQLSGEGFTQNLIYRMKDALSTRRSSISNKEYSPEKLKIIVFIEGIDRLFNVGFKVHSDSEFPRGRAAAVQQVSQYAAEFRTFMLENSRKVSVFATCGLDTSFMEDEKWPLFQYFNVLELDPLSRDESWEYIKKALRKNTYAEPLKRFLQSFSEDWFHYLTDGRFDLLNDLLDTFTDMEREEAFSTIDADSACRKFLNKYFKKNQAEVELAYEDIPQKERYLLDIISMLHEPFGARDLPDSDNLQKNLKSLAERGLISAKSEGRGSVARYSMASKHLKAFLRFYKFAPISRVLDPHVRSESLL